MTFTFEYCETRNRIKELRIAKGITQKQLADRTGISLKAIQGYEQGLRSIHKAELDSAIAIADVLGVDVKDLF